MIDQQQLLHNWNYALYPLDSAYTGRLAQTITPQASGFLTTVKLWTRKDWSTVTGTLIIEIRDANEADFIEQEALNPNGAVDVGNLLASQSIPANDLTYPSSSELTINFSNPAFITAGVQYSIVLRSTDTTKRVYIYASGGTPNPYTGGRAWNYYNWNNYWYTDNPPTTYSDIYFITYVSMNTIWEDINCDLRCAFQVLSDINSDIRVVSEHTVIRDINSDIRSAQRVLKDINCDIRVTEDYTREYDINSDIRVSDLALKDINCDIRCQGEQPFSNLYNIDCDIRVISRHVYDVNCDIRVQEDNRKTYNINCDIRVKQPTPIGLDGFRVYLDGEEISDVKVDSINWQWTMNETPASASFRIVRKSDNFNKTLKDISQAVNTNLPMEIKFDSKLKYYGYVMSLNVEQSGESVIVNCLDRKQKIQEELLDVSYGRKWDAPEPGNIQITNAGSTGEALIEILDQLVTAGIISSYSGVPNGIIPEYQETQGMPAGTLITELLDLSGNYYWNITPNGILEIYEANMETLKNLPCQESTRQVHLYDIMDYNFRLNDRSNLITDVEVNMGIESAEERASYRIVSIINVQPAWDGQYGNIYNDHWGMSADIDYYRTIGILPYYSNITEDITEKHREVGRKWRISEWTEGSFIDPTFKPLCLNPGANNYAMKGWSWGGEYLNLAVPLLYVKYTTTWTIGASGERFGGRINEYGFNYPYLVGRFYRKEEVHLATNPTIFDITWDGIAGSGAKRKITLSQLGIRDSIGWTAYEEGQLVAKSEQGYDDTKYATDRANLMLSRINDPITEGSINLTFDAFEYYNLKLGSKINLTGTEEANIYNNNNGFPLDIQSINFDAGSYIVTLNVQHLRNFKATENFR